MPPHRVLFSGCPVDYVVVDMSNLLSRLFYGAHGAASWTDRVGMALVGLRPNLARLADRFPGSSPAFVFDAPPYKRTALFPDYKAGKHTVDDDDKGEALTALKKANTRLGREVLNAIGYTNLYARLGYEADDLCWAVRDGLAPGDRCILVSGDRDLYQLLDRRCAVYDPQRDAFTTANTFRAEFGIEPRRWADVKALAGGKDGIDGCPGVAEPTAVKWLRGEIPAHHKQHANITGFLACGGLKQNLELCVLPFDGLAPVTPVPQPPPDSIRWGDFYPAFGLPAPVDPRRTARG